MKKRSILTRIIAMSLTAVMLLTDTTVYASTTNKIGDAEKGSVNTTLDFESDGTNKSGTLGDDGTYTYTGQANVDSEFLLEAPEKAGYTFDYWKVSKKGLNLLRKSLTIDNEFLEDESITDEEKTKIVASRFKLIGVKPGEEVTFKAYWQVADYTITYDLDGGELPAGKTNPTTYTIKTNTFTLNNPTKAGHQFIGWTGSNGTVPQEEVSVSKGSYENKTFTAVYQADTCTVSFDANGATGGAMTPQLFTYGENQPLNENKYTREHTAIYEYNGADGGNDKANDTATAVFTGWAATATGNKQYSNKQSVGLATLPTADENGRITLYATWSLGDITLPTPTKTGSTFSGWYYDAAFNDLAGIGGNKLELSENVRLYAKFSADPYMLKFNMNGHGTQIATQTVSYGGKGTRPSDPAEEGCSFVNWYKEKACINLYDFDTPITGETTIYAKWNVTKYDVTFNGNGKAANTTTQVEHGQTVTKPADPTADGYTFDGWYTEAACTTPYNFNIKIKSATTIFAKWTEADYRITYDLKGGTVSETNPSGYKISSENITLNNPTKRGSKFVGWTGSNGTIPQTTVVIEKGNHGDKNYVANYEAAQYTVAFDGTTASSGSMDDIECTYDTEITLPENRYTKASTVTFEYNGATGGNTEVNKTIPSTFAGWAKSENGSKIYNNKQANVKNITDIDGETVTLYALWNDGSITLPTPTKNEYVFDGWYEDADFGGAKLAAGSNYTPITSTTLYAKWKHNAYTVKFNANGHGVAPSEIKVEHGQTATKPADPTTNGYYFDGWYKEDYCSTKYDFSTPVTGDLELFASWKNSGFQVKFDGNYATKGTMDSQTFKTDNAQKLSPNKYERAYVVTFENNGADGGDLDESRTATSAFNGWAIEKTGEKKYDDNEEVFNITTDATITLYANWTLGTITLPTPAKDGFDFGGWYKDADFNNQIGTGGESYTPTTDITLYAKWTNDGFTVSFNGNGATAGTMSPQDFAFGDYKSLNQNKYQRYYTVTYQYNGATGGKTMTSARATSTFGGWATEAEGLKAYNDRERVNAEKLPKPKNGVVTLYATWSLGTVNLPAPTKTGSVFGGWFEDETFTKPVTTNGKTYTPKSDITLYAKWNSNGYTVKFSGNQATNGNMKSQDFKYNQQGTLLPNGYERVYTTTFAYNDATAGNTNASLDARATFLGWASTATGPVEYQDKETVVNLTTSGTKTLYAKWELASITLPKPQKTGFLFDGWYKDAGFTNKLGGAEDLYTPTASTTIYAKWIPLTYFVSFVGNSHTSGSMTPQMFEFNEEQSLNANQFERKYTVTYNYNEADGGTRPANAVATATFNGWAESKSGAEKYDDKQTVNNLTTVHGATVYLYANWTLNTVILPTPTRTGYEFGGWYADNSTFNQSIGNGGVTYKPTKDIPIYAKWIPIQYTIKYDGNKPANSQLNVTGSTASSTHTYDASEPLTTNGFSLAGYTFKGWTLNKDGSGTVYTNGQNVKNLSSTKGATVTLYAKWEPNNNTKYIVKHYKMTTSGTYNTTPDKTEPLTGTTDTTVKPAVQNYGAGFTAPSATTVKIKGDGTSVVEYKYTRNKFKFTLGSATGASTTGSTATGTYFYEAAITLKGAATTGYTWSKWKIGATEDTKASTTTTMPAADITATPVVTANKYTITYNKNKPSTASNEVTGTTSNSTHTYDAVNDLATNGYALKGWRFAGWYKEAACQNKVGDSGAKNIGNLASAQGATVTLYAKWVANTYTVVYNKNNPENESTYPITQTMGNSTFTYDNASTKLSKNTFVQSKPYGGYKFIGWATSSTGNKAYNDEATGKLNLTDTHNGTVNLYAKWEVVKIAGSVTAPTAKTLTYNGSDQTLINAGSTSTGTIQYKLNSGSYGTSLPVAKTAGTYTVYYKVVGDKYHNDVAEANIKVTINKKAAMNAAPTAKTLTYNGKAQALINAGTVHNGTMYYKLGSSGNYGTAVPSATNAGTYDVYYKVIPSDTTNYSEKAETKITVTIAKAEGSVTAPTAKTLTYNGSAQTLINAGSTSTGTIKYKVGTGSYGTTLPTGTNAGNYTVYYMVTGDSNHKDVAEKSLSVTIAKRTPTVTAPTAKTLTYTGSAQALVNAGSTNGGSLQYKLNSNGTYGTTIPTGTNAGSYTVYYKVVGDSNNNSVNEKTVSVTISKAAGNVTAPTAKTLTYTGSAQTLINAGSSTTGTIQYKLNSNGTYGTSLPSATNAGTYTVYYKVVSTSNNHNDVAEKTVSVTIAKRTPTVTAPTAKTLTYTGSAQALVNAGSTNGGSIQYKNGSSGTYSTSIPTGTNAGSYTVYYKVVGDTNNNDVAEKSLSVTIAKRTPTVTAPTAKTLTYTGSAQALVNAGSTNGGSLQYKLNDGAYSTSIPSATATGTYTVYYKVVGDSNNNDVAEKSVSVTIKPNTCTVTIKYNGHGGTDTTKTITNGAKLSTILSNPTATGYSFGGWYSNSGLTTAVSLDSAITSDITLYAKWSLVNYTVTLNLNGGSASWSSTTYNIESNAFMLPTPTRSGYGFNGWSGSFSGYMIRINKGTTGNLTFTANWTQEEYTLALSKIIRQSFKSSYTLTIKSYDVSGTLMDSQSLSFTKTVTPRPQSIKAYIGGRIEYTLSRTTLNIDVAYVQYEENLLFDDNLGYTITHTVTQYVVQNGYYCIWLDK